MPIARSRLTSRGRTSVPIEIRRQLGLEPGSILVWYVEGNTVTVRGERCCSLDDIHRTLFPEGAPAARSLRELKEGIRRDIAKRHARR